MSETTPDKSLTFDVFLSYSRIDPEVKAAAATLEIALKQANLTVFKDDYAIRTGDRWVEKLQEALNDCGSFVVLIGREGVWRWVGAEVQVALIRHFGPHHDDERLPLFPILLEGAKPESLPPFLALFQATDWSPGQGLPEDLIAAIQARAIRHQPIEKIEGCPFRGLDAFTWNEQDVKLFFGRRMETLHALAKLGDQQQSNPDQMINAGGNKYTRWLQIEGNSGAGKSSLVRAGMLPMIEKDALWARTGFEHWRILGPMMPGASPLTKLAEIIERDLIEKAAERKIANRLKQLKQEDAALAVALRAFKEDKTGFLLVIDQFEELFTFSEDAERIQFDAVVAGALKDPDCPLFMITTVRLDFLDRIERLPKLLDVYNRGIGDHYILPTMSEDGLREIMEGPARLAGLDVSEVTSAILNDARNESGALPLVGNTLSTLWQKMEPNSNKLSGKLYSELGGLAGILASQSDALLTRIHRAVSGGKQKTLELLLRLTRINDEGRHSRRRVTLNEAIDVAGEGDERTGARVIRLLSGERDHKIPSDDRPRGSLRLITVGEDGTGTAGITENSSAPNSTPGRPAAKKVQTVDLIHETLIRAREKDAKIGKRIGYWPTLYNYIEANRDRDILRQQLKFQTEQWTQSRGLGRWWHLAGWSSLWQYRRLRVGKKTPESGFLFWSRWVFRIQAAVTLAFFALFGQAVVWVNQNEKLPFGYAFYQPLWLLGWYEPLPEMVQIPAESFEMGCKPERDLVSGLSECPGEELPAHRVEIERPFQIGKYEVSFLEYDYSVWDRKQRGENLDYPQDENWGRYDRPVIKVSWEDAQAYVKWLRKKTNDNGYRLPSEAQWEYAARGGNKNDTYWWGTTSSEKNANCGTSTKTTTPVNSFQANGYGLHDTSGNVWEWVEDNWHNNYGGSPVDGSAWTEEDDAGSRVRRGGSWLNAPGVCRAALRFHYSPYNRDFSLGFRVAHIVIIPEQM